MAGVKQIMYGVTDFARMRVDYADRFDEHCRLVIDQFARHYAARLPAFARPFSPHRRAAPR